MINKPFFSVVVPVFNEEENVELLYKETKDALEKLAKDYEIIFVDDGSTDKTYSQLKKLSPLTIIKFRTNSGQSAALDAGIKQARGEIIFTLDGDGQNDPADFSLLYKKLTQGFDVVCGWRHKRKDSFSRRFISYGARVLRLLLVDDRVHDAGCTLRVYRRECFVDLDLYGELHRMIPALLRWRGFRIGEVKVNHRPRIHGRSKYNLTRAVKGFLDMIYIWFWRKYAQRPLHFFGGLGLAFNFLGGLILALMAYLKVFYHYHLSDKIWPLVGFFLIMIGIQLLATGLLAAREVEKDKSVRYYISEVIHSP